MQLGLINSAWAQAGKATSYGIQKTKEIGFDCIDIFADPLDTDAKERRLIRTECEKAGLPIISVACVATGLIDFNPSVQRFHMDRCNKYLDMCYEFDAKNLLLVLGEYIWEKQVIPPQEQWNTAVHNTRELSLVNNVESMVRFLDQVNHPAVQANIDVSHLLLSNTPASELKKLKGKAIHVHISDCDGKVHGDLPPGKGVVDFPPYLEEIKKLNVPGAISIELEYSPEPEKIYEWVLEAYQSTSKLLKQAGLRG